MRRRNPLILSDKEDDFLAELLRRIARWASKDPSSDGKEFVSFDTYEDDAVRPLSAFRTNFVLRWEPRLRANCEIKLELTSIRETFDHASYYVDSESIVRAYSKFGVLLDKGWIPNVEGFYISSLEVPSSCRGQGVGLHVLETLIELSERHEIYLVWDYNTNVKRAEPEGSKAIENLKAWYQKAGGLFSPIASSLEIYDFVYPDYILKPYKGLVSAPEPITRLNPSEIAGAFLSKFPRKWWYTDEDWKIMVNAIQRQYNDPDNHYNGKFFADEFELEDLDTSLAEEHLIDLMEKAGNPMIGLSADWATTAFGLGEPELIMHFGVPVEVYPYVLVQDDEDIDRPWALLEYTGDGIDPDTDRAEYNEIKSEISEHYLGKLMAKEYAEFRADHGAEPLKFPTRTNRGVSTVKVAKKVIRDSKGRKIPAKYLKGYKGKKLTQRKKEIEQRRDEYKKALEKYDDEDNFPKSVIKKLYRPFETDKGIKSKPSSYTVEAKRRGFTGSISNKAKQASEYYGGKIPQSVLKEVNARGMAAWTSGGHRPGQTSHSWGIARVNSFLVGGKTFFTADKGLASKLPEEVQTAIKKERHWKGN